MEREGGEAELEEQAVEVGIADPEARRAGRPLDGDPAGEDVLAEGRATLISGSPSVNSGP